jgi:hypothetical protein
MQAKTAVSWHVRPPSEAESVVEEGRGPMEEGHGPMKEENLRCADYEECLMQAKTAVRWHVRPPSEAKSVVEEGHGPLKEENLLLVSCKPTVFERNRAHGEHISLLVEHKGAFRQGVSPLAEAICLSLFPKLLYRLNGLRAIWR